MHRGDSPGEGGSNAYFLANRKRRHEPLSCLFNKLTEKLTDRSLIISAGSNTNQSLRRKLRRQKQFAFGTFEWRHVDAIGGRRTTIWEVVRIDAA